MFHVKNSSKQPILTFLGDILVSIRDLHQKKKLVLVLPVLGTTRTWTWHAKKVVICVTELTAAFIHETMENFKGHTGTPKDKPDKEDITEGIYKIRLAIFSVNIHGNLRQQLTIFRENFDWSLSLTFERCRSYRDLLQ